MDIKKKLVRLWTKQTLMVCFFTILSLWYVFNSVFTALNNYLIIEYQGNGNPHLHLLLKRLDNCTLTTEYVNSLLSWDKGTIDIQRLYDANGLSEYLNPFIVSTKRERLKLYKSGQQIYRCYGQFVRPQKLKMTAEEALRLVEENQLTEFQSKSYVILNDDEIVNHITKKLYNRRKELNNYGKQN